MVKLHFLQTVLKKWSCFRKKNKKKNSITGGGGWEGLKSKRVIGVFDFNPLLPRIRTVINKHIRAMISENPELSKVFPDPPMAALRQGPNLRNLLCKSKLPKILRNPIRSTHRNSAGWKRCSASGGRSCN